MTDLGEFLRVEDYHEQGVPYSKADKFKVQGWQSCPKAS